MSTQLKEIGRYVEQLKRRLESTQNELSQSSQLVAAQHARADTLEQQLTQIRKAPVAKRKPSSRKPKPKRDP
jgi:septal ring factor EnvC (AmiA/AmiB activator)